MFVRIWEFEVPIEAVDSFIAAYGPAGDWAQLFSRSPGYLRTKLYRDTDPSGHFLTVDSWTDQEHWQAFLDRWREHYEALDVRLEALTEGERLVYEGST